MRKLIRLLYRESSGLHEAALILGGFALISQILALLRDRLFAHNLGVGLELDIYYAAFRVPDLIFVSVASLVAITVIMPILIEKKKEGVLQAQLFIRQVFTVFFILISVLSIIVYFLLPTIIPVIFSGFSVGTVEQVVTISRILLLSPILLGISNIYASITQMSQKFFIYALAPVLYNLGIIIGLLYFYPIWGVSGLACGVILGAMLHMLIQVPIALRDNILPSFTLNIKAKELLNILSIAIPRTIGLSVTQITFLILTSLATLMAVGSISIFQLAFNLQSVPLSIIGVSYSMAAFPALAKLWADEKKSEYNNKIIKAILHITYWSLPLMMLFIVLKEEIVSVVLGSGSFGVLDIQITSQVLSIFVISVYAQSLVLLFVRAYYAAGITRKPVLINVFSALIILGVAYTLNLGVIGLSIAYSIGMILNAIILFVCFLIDFKIQSKQLLLSILHIFIASLFVALITYLSLFVFKSITSVGTLSLIIQGVLSSVVGLSAGVFYLFCVKNKEQQEIYSLIKNRITKK